MDKNLIAIIFSFEILVFSWLIREVILVKYNLDILDSISTWLKRRPIILPSVFLLLSPFIIGVCYSNIKNILVVNGSFATVKNIFTPVITVITTVVSLLIVNLSLENIKQNKQKEKTAKILIAFIKKQLQIVPQSMGLFLYDLNDEESKKRTGLQKRDIPRMKVFLSILEIDSITSSSLENIGLFDIRAIEFIFTYFYLVDYWKRLFIRFIDDLNSDSKLLASHIFELDIKIFLVNSYVAIATLSKDVNEEDYLGDCMKEIEKELSLVEKIYQDELGLIGKAATISHKNKCFYEEIKQGYESKYQQLFTNSKRFFKYFGLSYGKN